ncbi:hypothetical protein L0668_06130 [Paraglaciecola aquimarina]|uniref:PEP-CTERM sorting domain-containing protein n=1 Tax=Paraglaciecola algarum TaxID=3050085 RepID=A0ABS9D6M4_9ALTE|nr:hypothetical protein [Paraglaciecola sp. G1-23]MCF2947677.1 hypothetical protein [Paraglaciecola sp. G1-23]
MKKVFGVVFFFCLSVKFAQAGLIQWDAFNTGDELAVKDQSTGLIWLDLSQTAGINYNNVSSLFAGWELPNYSLVESLLDNVFPDVNFIGTIGEPKKYEQKCANTTSCYTSAIYWQSLFGSVVGSQYYQTLSYGFYSDSDDILRMGGAYVNGSGSANRYGVDFTENYSTNYQNKFTNGDYQNYSTFLIKSDSIVRQAPIMKTSTFSTNTTPVSEPNSMLFFSSLFLLILLQRKRFNICIPQV